jgi:hypothetical protein
MLIEARHLPLRVTGFADFGFFAGTMATRSRISAI